MKKPERKIIKRRWKEYRNLVSKIDDWDYTSILEVERLQMLRVAKQIEIDPIKHDHWEEDVKWIRLAVKILDTLLNDTYWEGEKGGCRLIPYVNTKNYKRFIDVNEEFINTEVYKMLLYEEKLWWLYNKIRLYKMRSWWT